MFEAREPRRGRENEVSGASRAAIGQAAGEGRLQRYGLGIAWKGTSTMYRSGRWRTAIEIWVVSRSCVYKGQRAPRLKIGTQQPVFWNTTRFVRLGSLSPSHAVFPSASRAMFPSASRSYWRFRSPRSHRRCRPPVRSCDSGLRFRSLFPVPVLFPVSDSVSFPVSFPISDSVPFPIPFPVSDSVPFPVPFHISDSVPRSSTLHRHPFRFPFRIPFLPRLPPDSASRCFSLCSRVALLYTESSA